MRDLKPFELLEAIQECLKDGSPVPLWAIETHAGPNAAATLVREASARKLVVVFRYPPLPCGAVLAIHGFGEPCPCCKRTPAKNAAE